MFNLLSSVASPAIVAAAVASGADVMARSASPDPTFVCCHTVKVTGADSEGVVGTFTDTGEVKGDKEFAGFAWEKGQETSCPWCPEIQLSLDGGKSWHLSPVPQGI